VSGYCTSIVGYEIASFFTLLREWAMGEMLEGSGGVVLHPTLIQYDVKNA
jgi:hypothetical protein